MGGGGINKINSLSFIFDIYFFYLNFNDLIPNVDWQTDFLVRCWQRQRYQIYEDYSVVDRAGKQEEAAGLQLEWEEDSCNSSSQVA